MVLLKGQARGFLWEIQRSENLTGPLTHRGDIDTVLVAGVPSHGLRAAAFDGGPSKHCARGGEEVRARTARSSAQN